MTYDYGEFLARKAVTAPMRGTDLDVALGAHLFPFQRACVEFGLRAGSWGCYLDTGLGKSLCQLEWASHAAEQSNGTALILTPLAVAQQFNGEGQRFGYQTRVVRSQADVGPGVNICNYDRLHLLTPDTFGAVALDEASILKSFTGKVTRSLIESFEGHRWRMAATATPAPNDHMELGQQSEFLGIMPSSEMLMRWFIADQQAMGTYRLKNHAVSSFWDWMASWSRMATHPRDLGDEREGFDLPPLVVTRHAVEHAPLVTDDGLFAGATISATDMHKVKRQTATSRAVQCADLAASTDTPWVLWCDTDYEADALWSAVGDMPRVVEVRGSHSIDAKERAIAEFLDGTARVLIAKPSACGFGLNLQHCHDMAFVGRSFSYEAFYQAVRRCWRFGQPLPVNVHLVVADGEDAIGRVIDRKADDHGTMKRAMANAMRRAMGIGPAVRAEYQPTHEGRLPDWLKGATL